MAVIDAAVSSELPIASPILSTSRSKRFGGADPGFLEEIGYVEEEFFLTGIGSIYRYGDDGSVVTKRAAIPYTTLILVRRPADPARFSGNVVVEAMHRGGPWGMTFGLAVDLFAGNGDAWVQAVSGRFTMLEGPMGLDPVQYAPLNLTDEGQVWDILAQLGKLIKSPSGAGLFGGLTGRHIYMTGTSGTGLMLLTYLGDGFDRRHRLDDGSPIYDGFIPFAAHGSLNYTRIGSPSRGINGAGEFQPHPSEQIPMDDPRRTVRGHDVPVIQVVTEAEVIIPFSPPPVSDMMLNMYNNGLPPTEAERLRYRREDSDDPEDLYRLYEIAGAAHDGGLAESMRRLRGMKETPRLRMGNPREPLSDFPAEYPLCAAFANLYKWVEKGVPAPRAERIQVDEDTVSVVRDEHGNARGGVRLPQLEAPAATYRGVNAGAALMGTKTQFSNSKMRELYGDHQTYIRELINRTNEARDAGWLLPVHAERVINEAKATEDLFET